MRGRRAAFVVASSALTACGFALDGYSNGAAQADGGAIAEAGVEAQASSGDAGVEAGIDGGLDCTGAFLCDDFERTDLLGPWDSTVIDSSSSVTLTTDHAFTGTRSLRMTIGAAADQSASLTKATQTASQIDLSYLVYRETEAKKLNMMEVLWSATDANGGTSAKIFALFDVDQIFFVEQSYVAGTQKVFVQTSGVPLPLEQWTRVVLHIDFAAKTYTAKVGDSAVVNQKPMTANYAAVAPQVRVGSDFSAAGIAMTIDIDDYVLKLTP